ncbi:MULTISPECIES: hypothetical protein [Streptomyces]|uniref:Uncharacterized protein n=1 Tax=Streptomyces eurythermus TaxID=42237 RepID=A0ABW6YWK0_9ACTN|nr:MULTISPECIES: hypothetical protein [Streptomyces]QIS70356.1 hypothetical protein HB370_10385 [Streptomyces sp. DSM 40868]
MDLRAGQVAVDTGAASGIGLAMARRFAAEVAAMRLEEPVRRRGSFGSARGLRFGPGERGCDGGASVRVW